MRMRHISFIVALLAVIVFAMPAFAGRKLHVSKGQLVYVPVYSHVYQGPKDHRYKLSALLSLRNVDATNSITISYVKYYGDNGTLVKNFFEKPVVIPPLGTEKVFIPERDKTGGSGSNFTVKWESETEVSVPIIQAVMIGTASTQGISFVCDGVAIEED